MVKCTNFKFLSIKFILSTLFETKRFLFQGEGKMPQGQRTKTQLQKQTNKSITYNKGHQTRNINMDATMAKVAKKERVKMVEKPNTIKTLTQRSRSRAVVN